MICLQADRYQNDKASGCATFYFGSEQGKLLHDRGTPLRVHPAGDSAPHQTRQLRQPRPHLDLLRMTQMPCVEVVTGYLTNPGDVRILTNPAKTRCYSRIHCGRRETAVPHG